MNTQQTPKTRYGLVFEHAEESRCPELVWPPSVGTLEHAMRAIAEIHATTSFRAHLAHDDGQGWRVGDESTREFINRIWYS